MLLLALICLLTAVVWSAFQRAWPLMLLAAGLLLWAASGHPDLHL